MRLKWPFPQVNSFMYFSFSWLSSSIHLKVIIFTRCSLLPWSLWYLFSSSSATHCFFLLLVSRKTKASKLLKRNWKYKNQEEDVAYFFPDSSIWFGRTKKRNTFLFEILKRKKNLITFQSALTFALINKNICKCRLILHLYGIVVSKVAMRVAASFPSTSCNNIKWFPPALRFFLQVSHRSPLF